MNTNTKIHTVSNEYYTNQNPNVKFIDFSQYSQDDNTASWIMKLSIVNSGFKKLIYVLVPVFIISCFLLTAKDNSLRLLHNNLNDLKIENNKLSLEVTQLKSLYSVGNSIKKVPYLNKPLSTVTIKNTDKNLPVAIHKHIQFQPDKIPAGY